MWRIYVEFYLITSRTEEITVGPSIPSFFLYSILYYVFSVCIVSTFSSRWGIYVHNNLKAGKAFAQINWKQKIQKISWMCKGYMFIHLSILGNQLASQL